MKTASMLLRHLKPSCDISAKLSVSFCDKYVSSAFMYGSFLRRTAKTFTLLCLKDQMEEIDTRVPVTNMLRPRRVVFKCQESKDPDSKVHGANKAPRWPHEPCYLGRKSPESTRHTSIILKNMQATESILFPIMKQRWRNYIHIITKALLTSTIKVSETK